MSYTLGDTSKIVWDSRMDEEWNSRFMLAHTNRSDGECVFFCFFFSAGLPALTDSARANSWLNKQRGNYSGSARLHSPDTWGNMQKLKAACKVSLTRKDWQRLREAKCEKERGVSDGTRVTDQNAADKSFKKKYEGSMNRMEERKHLGTQLVAGKHYVCIHVFPRCQIQIKNS